MRSAVYLVHPHVNMITAWDKNVFYSELCSDGEVLKVLQTWDTERSSCVERARARGEVEKDTYPNTAHISKRRDMEKKEARDEKQSKISVSHVCRWLLEEVSSASLLTASSFSTPTYLTSPHCARTSPATLILSPSQIHTDMHTHIQIYSAAHQRAHFLSAPTQARIYRSYFTVRQCEVNTSFTLFTLLSQTHTCQCLYVYGFVSYND